MNQILLYGVNLFNMEAAGSTVRVIWAAALDERNTMSRLSLIYFLVVTFSTGCLIDLFVNNWRADWLEKSIMRIGVGLAAMSVIGVILNLFHVPLDYRIFLGIGLLILIGAFLKNKPFSSAAKEKVASTPAQCWKRRTFWYSTIMLVLFALTVKMYVGGAFKYDYLEDTDPWGYAAVSDYIGEMKTYTPPYYSIQYNEPYTQGYQIVMGVLSQTNDSIYWTMKFFTSFIISFSIPFMYYFARRFSRSDEIGLFAAFFLFSVPAWVSHFVYSLHYNMTLFVVLLYVLARLMDEQSGTGMVPDGKSTTATERSARMNGWAAAGIVVYGSMFINHLTSVFHGTIFIFVFIAARILSEKRIEWKTISIFIGGFLLSLLFIIPACVNHWWIAEIDVPPTGIGGIEHFFSLIRFAIKPVGSVVIILVLVLAVLIFRSRKKWQPPFEKWIDAGNRGMFVWLCGLALVLLVLLQPMKITHILGTADRYALGVTDPYYGIKDFFSASSRNMINSPTGLGFVLMSLVVFSFLLASARIKKLFNPENAWIAVSYSWIITAFLLVLGKYFSIAIIPFRAWTFLGLFASLFAAWGVVASVRIISKNYWILMGIMALTAIVVIPTAFIPKYLLNTAIWKDIMLGTPESRELFSWMRNGGIPKNSVVAHLCGNSEFLSGYDMNPPLWNEVFHPRRGVEEPYFVTKPLDITPEAYNVLRNARVEYVSIGASCLWQMPQPTAEKEEALGNRIGEAMRRYKTDNRLSLIKDTGYELLFKLN